VIFERNLESSGSDCEETPTGATCTLPSHKYGAPHRAYLIVSFYKSRVPYSIF
jgi:hypothetical protein